MTASAFELLGALSYRVKDLVTAGEATWRHQPYGEVTWT